MRSHCLEVSAFNSIKTTSTTSNALITILSKVTSPTIASTKTMLLDRDPRSCQSSLSLDMQELLAPDDTCARTS